MRRYFVLIIVFIIAVMSIFLGAPSYGLGAYALCVMAMIIVLGKGSFAQSSLTWLGRLFLFLLLINAVLSALRFNQFEIGQEVRIEGLVRQQTVMQDEQPRGYGLLLGSARIVYQDKVWNIPLLRVEISQSRYLPWLVNKRIWLGGYLSNVDWSVFEPSLKLAKHDYHLTQDRAFSVLNSLRRHLYNRANYYLSNTSATIYNAVLLGYSPPSRSEVRSIFVELGLSHLLAISGLHIMLIFGITLGLIALVQRYLIPIRPSSGLHNQQLLIIALMLTWVYILFIDWPVSAVRAGFIVSALSINHLSQLKCSRFYVLFCVALILLCLDFSLVYSLSFQFSFLAYFCVLLGIAVLDKYTKNLSFQRSWQRKLYKALLGNLLITSMITLLMWPITMYYFQKVSLFVLLSNLLIVPMFGVLIMPVFLIIFMTGLLFAYQQPDGLIETNINIVGGAIIDLWALGLSKLNVLAKPFIIQDQLTWSAEIYLAYYSICALMLYVLFNPQILKARPWS